jgi:nucleotide-binding universal stress UspA family protein
MRIVVWLAEGTWRACVDAARDLADQNDEIVLVHVLDPGLVEGLHGAFAARLGRGGHGRDPGDAVEELGTEHEQQLLTAAAHRLSRPAVLQPRRGQPEREVLAACGGANVLVLARDGDHSHLGPHSIGPATRFILDHAPCQVLLVWPDQPPALETLPPAPHEPHPRPPR